MSRHSPPAIAARLVHGDGERVRLSAALWGGPAHEYVSMSIASAYQLGRDLVDEAEATLAGVARPWDDDPGRTPFVSRPPARTGRLLPDRPAGPAPGGRRATRDGYPRARGVRPDGGVESGDVKPLQTRDARPASRASQPTNAMDPRRGTRRT